MRRDIDKKLYQELIDTKFTFVKRGERNISEIYDSVKKRFPELCDDDYFCSDHCRSGGKQPEWNHVVRSAMQNKTIDNLKFTGKKGFWIFY